MKACLVIPCYNEAERLQSEKFLEHVKNNPHHSFIFVNDGSSDQTLLLLKNLSRQSEQIHYLDLVKNSGKAEAVRYGMLEAYKKDFTHIGFLDADLTIPLETAGEMIQFLYVEEKEFVYASRQKRVICNKNQNLLRKLLSCSFSKFSRLLIGLPVNDTQCGAKFFRSHLIPVLFKESFISRWVFDVEVFFRFKYYFEVDVEENLLEFPLTHWDDNTTTKIKLKDYLKVPLQLVKIAFAYRFNRLFSPSSESLDRSKEYINKKAS